ncbi:MAG: chromosome segregation protein, partial [Pseudomonadota bacterium]|nr:chromosome segregation protein [Pseudomonadota bacterium]
SRASVELVFDNADHRAGGQWGQFAEIAVKRVLTRDGNSSYYINNQPVRRRDVQDVFMGTGLGPRAYAIIGQGTISRIIESKPEELRLFLEDAAGVSKYKERRRETENRLKDTRENLTRVDDILRELNSNLDKLEKQAEVATRYHALQEQGTLKLHQLWFLKHRDAATEETRIRLAVAEATNALEARLAELRGVEAQLEQVRQDHYAASDALHLAQGELAEANLAVSRLEERIRYVVEGRQKVEQRLAELKGQNEQWLERRAAAEFELEELAEKMLAAEEQAEILAAQSVELAGNLPSFEDAVRSATQRANTQRGVAGQVQQQIQLLAAESRNIDDQSRQFTLRRERLSSEKHALGSPDEARLTDLKRQLEAVQEELALSEAQLGELTEQVPELDEARKAQQHESQTQAARQAELTARLEALRALQEKVQTEGKLKPWLAKHGLDSLQGLWRKVHIEPGWEIALESALRERLSALEVGRVETVRAFEQDAPPAKLAFYSLPQAGIQNTHATLPRLSDQLRLQDASLKALMNDWLEGVYTAANLEEALANRQRLTHGEVIMTRAGHTVSQFAVSFYAPDSEQAGLLARAQEIEGLDKQVRAQALIAEDARASLIRAEAHYTDASQRLATTRRQTSEVQQRAHQLQVEVLRLAQQAEQAQARHGQIAEELAEIDAQLDELQERRASGEARFEELDLSLADAQEQHAQLEEAVMEAERKLNQAREQARAQERQAQEAQFSARAMASRRGELQRSIETSAQQIQLNEASVAQLLEEQARLSDASAHTGLDEALAVRVAKEGLLAQARTHYDDLSAQLRRADEQRMGFERSLQPLRDEITKLQLEQQAATLGGAQFLEQLTAAEVDLTALADVIERDGIKLYGLQTEIDRIQREINALGAVNLAALEELTAARERKGFLDSQMADLSDAIGTLEDAIHKIDLETRDLLGATFNTVNEHFGRMFPSLFGGGSARLVMTGDEILDAGVQVMAHPPGKKNSTIHLLSGGEKALTAIALVFAIFQLNPAPFCLLDEVDAPLDDANTERYARLVKSMSSGTQFLFISHNKIAMEMAEQLVGVTMQEQGVSRIVAVDMEAALGMAHAT